MCYNYKEDYNQFEGIYMFKFKGGFTLAEVLITLVIIGIIAAMTIPQVINNTNEQENVVATKEAFSILSQAYNRVLVENGGTIEPSSLGSSGREVTQNFGDIFAKQMHVQNNCGVRTDEECFANGMYKYLDGSDWVDWNKKNYYKVRLANGMSLGFIVRSEYVERGTSDALKHVITDIYVDVNGDKGPNVVGKDTFGFWMTKYGVIPFGVAEVLEDNYGNINTCKTTGRGCTFWVVTQNNMDYLHKDISM